ncbi:MAG: biotin/lipoyl-binding protein, partial [Hyphomicrobiales bacterium]
MTHRPHFRNVLLGGVVLVAALAAAPSVIDTNALFGRAVTPAEAAAPAAMPAMPVSVAVVTSQPITPWNSFSGRLEAVDHVDLRSRVAGAIDKVNFKEGALVNKGDLLVT